MRTVRRSYRIRAYPNGAQRRWLDRWFGATRWLWNTTLEIRSEAYRVSFSVEVETSWLPIVQRSVGVDLGLTHLATLSTGEKIPNPKRYHARLRYLRQQQRCLARRQPGSRRREKQRLRVARVHAKVRQERQYSLHRLTTRLVQEFDLICIEDLNVKGLARGRLARGLYDAAF